MINPVMHSFDIPFMFDDDTMHPFGYEFSLHRDDDMAIWKKALVPKAKGTTFDDDTMHPFGYEFSLRRDDDMVVWKKALVPKAKGTIFDPRYYEPVIVKLKIPKDAAVVFTPSKCRADRAIVLGFYPCEYNGEACELDITSAMSWYDHSYKYNLGQEIVPDYFDKNCCKTCSHGIHFFRNFDETVQCIF